MNSLCERNKFVEENMGLVYMIAKKFCGRGVDFDDIVQIGSVGLIKASERFNEEFNTKFSTYAVAMIIGEIKRFFRDDGVIKVPRKVKEIGNMILKASVEIRNKFEHEPTINELSDYIKVDLEKIIEAIEAMQPCSSLFAESENNACLYEIIEDNRELNAEIEDKILLKDMLGKLDSRLRQILILRFFKDKTQSEVAKVLKLSQVQVSRLEKKALEILKYKCKYDI